MSNIKIEGIRIIVSLFLDGSLHKISGQLPAFKVNISDFTPLDIHQVAERITQDLESHPLGKIPGKLTIGPSLIISNGKLRRAVIVSGILPINENAEEGRRGVLHVIV